MLELEIIVGDWITANAEKMTYEELVQFEEEIIDVENPHLNKYLVFGQPPIEEHDSKYLNILKDYVAERKKNFGKYNTHL
jgi:succinate dehydrogenase flavin-adding protein (antitoxin of CptAB toxin-antitoxin module)